MKLSILLLLPFAIAAHAQVFDGGDSAGSGGGNNGNNGGQQQKPKQLLGQDVPFMDPGSETAQWDGHMWNVTNNRLFRARFEKYLATPEENAVKDKEYRELLLNAMKAMSPSNQGGPDVALSMRLLVKAADYPIDARLCDSIAQAVYGVVLHRKNEKLLAKINKEMEKERYAIAWNFEVAADAARARAQMSAPTPGGSTGGGNTGNGTTGQQTPARGGGAGGGGAAPAPLASQASEFTRVGSYVKRIVEIDAAKIANAAKMTASELKSKIEFQALIVQLFLQRRFEHVILSCRLYRNLYEDGDSELKLKEGSDVEKMFTRTTGTTPTVSALDALSSEFIRDVDEGVVSFEYLAEKNDLESASKRLSEAFMIGEYLPKMRTLPRMRKEQVLAFVRDGNQLLSAIEVKDYTLAEEIVERLRKSAKDFDYSKPRAAIETARAASGLHIQSARSAAIKKDDKKVAEEIEKAALIWPTNPDLKAFSTQVATYGDMHSRILNDLDTLLAQNNLREIWREQIKYTGAVLGKPEYEIKLKAALEKVGSVEKVVLTADELMKAGDNCGAWEKLKDASKDFPDDNEVNQRLAKLSERCSNFINALNDAKADEEKGRLGISLSAYLRAERIYPNSRMAKSGIERLSDKILPENEPDSSSPVESSVPVFSPEETLSPVNPPAPPAPAPR